MKTALFVVGSFRAESFNRQLAREAEALLAPRAKVEWLDFRDVPFMDQDAENPAPEAVIKAREAVLAADGVWFFTPEYNFSYPGLLKNLFDWLSRPVKSMDYETPTVINGKKVALSGAGGKMATAKCREKLKELLTFIKADVMELQTGVALNVEAWTEGRMTLSDEQRKALNSQADAFLKLLNG